MHSKAQRHAGLRFYEYFASLYYDFLSISFIDFAPIRASITLPAFTLYLQNAAALASRSQIAARSASGYRRQLAFRAIYGAS